jgi:Glycosyl transferase family 2
VADSPRVSLPGWKRYVYSVIAAEVSAMTRYYDRVVQPSRQRGDSGWLLERIDAPEKSEGDFDARGERDRRTAVLLNGTLNYELDIRGLLQRMKARLSRTSRIVAVMYNPYFALLYRAARRLGLKAGDDPTTFVTYLDLRNIAHLAGFEIVRVRTAVYCPFRLLGLGDIINNVLPLVPLIRQLAFVHVVVLRPVIADGERPSISIVVPARNEAGNIPAIIERMPDLDTRTEVLFIEGHSTDGTWDAIQAVAARHDNVRALRQTGKGKNDAVRLGIERATGDVVAILDADLSMPPEHLPDFFDAYCAGLADFVNGTRLVYPMEGEAMRFLNKLGNVFFAKALRYVLDIPITDSLCGTKLAARHDLARIRRWRDDFGDFDPFGDFELLFPAAVLGLGTIDLPIRYRARTYGSTNINRFRDGWTLLRMTAIALTRIRTGRLP